MREVIQERVNVASLAKKLRLEGVPSALAQRDDDFGPLPEPNSEESYAMWARYKPEQYAIGAIFADKVVRFAYEQTDVSGMIRSIADENNPWGPFRALGQKIRQETLASIQWNCEQVNKGAEPKLLPAYRRLNALINLENTLTIQHKNTVERYLEGGVNTAIEVMSNLLDLTVQLVRSVEDQQRIIRIAENSFPLIAKLASSHGAALISVLDIIRPLQFFPFDPDYFVLEDSNGKERLVLSEEGKDRIERLIGTREIEDFRTNTPVVGCIAMVNFGEGSAVKLMWDWHLEAVRTMKLRPGLRPD